MGLFNPPTPPMPPPPPPAANPPTYASGATLGWLARRNQNKPMGGTDLTTGMPNTNFTGKGVGDTAALGLAGNKAA